MGEPTRPLPFQDRRRTSTPMFSRYWLVGRRKSGRNEYVDRYHPWEWTVAATILLLCIADIVLTLFHLEAGGQEANPAMALLLRWGIGYFITVKMGVNLLVVLVMLLHIRFGRVRYLFNFLAICYVGVLLCHMAAMVI